MREHFDLVVIGGGPAGETGATYAAHLGKRVCLIERAPKPGGASVNTGTIPSKALRETALSFSGLRRRGPSGVDLRVKQGITIADFMVREREVIEASWRSIEARLQQHGVVQVQGTAGFVDANTVEVTRYGQPSRLIGGETFLLVTEGTQTPSLAGSTALRDWMTANGFKSEYAEVNSDHGGMVPLVLPDVFDFFDRARAAPN